MPMGDIPKLGVPNPNEAVESSAASPESWEAPPAPAKAAFAGGEEAKKIAQQLLTCHYSVHHGFFEESGGLLAHIDAVRGIPTIAIQGRNDLVCPVKTAYDLHLAWPELELHVVPGAGHSQYDSRIRHCLLLASDRYRMVGS